MVIASSISGLPIYAPSAAFAPTNSADVSAIASAYQVVSATATQLYAGTAYVTSVNDAPLSASRAGNAANASLASSAWYDGTGRLISALPDSATVSAIASAYAESAASDKLDFSAVGIDHDLEVVSSINEAYLSAWVAGSAEYWSGASSKQDTLTFSYDENDRIDAINGSALAGQGGGGGVDSATVSAIASSYAESAVSAYQPLSGMSSYASAFSAGEGLEFVQSGSDQVLQVEAPVDIVAGPGIVIDNPDGNTLRVSVSQDVNKVLWTGSMWDSNKTASLAEPASNFEYVLIYGHVHEATARGTVQVFPTSGSSYASLNCGNVWYSNFLCYNVSNTVLNLSGHNHAWLTGNGVNTGTDGLVITKIVGCARTASAQ